MPWSIRSRNCLDVLNCAAVGGLPPTMRLIASARACSPPAIAASTQVPPAAVYALASSLTAADSPPDVHQCSTSARFGCACACAPAAAPNASATASGEAGGLVVHVLSPCFIVIATFAAVASGNLQAPARRPLQELPERERRILGRAQLRRVVDVHEAEALLVAVAPLEVVHQRPREVSAHVHALAHRLVDGGEVAVEVARALRIVHVAGLDAVGAGHAVLGDVDRRQLRIALLELEQQVAQAVGEDLPAHLRALDAGQRLDDEAVPAVARDHLAEVVVDADEVERHADRGHVAVADRRRGLRPQLAQRRRVAAEEQRVERPVVGAGGGALGGDAVGGRIARRRHRADVGDQAHRRVVAGAQRAACPGRAPAAGGASPRRRSARRSGPARGGLRVWPM